MKTRRGRSHRYGTASFWRSGTNLPNHWPPEALVETLVEQISERALGGDLEAAAIILEMARREQASARRAATGSKRRGQTRYGPRGEVSENGPPPILVYRVKDENGQELILTPKEFSAYLRRDEQKAADRSKAPTARSPDEKSIGED